MSEGFTTKKKIETKEEKEQRELEKKAKIKSIFSYECNGEKIPFIPDAILALSGSIVAFKEGVVKEGYKKHKSPSYADLDNKGLISGGKARVIATAEASIYFPDAKIITNSRDGKSESIRPSHASVYKHELLTRPSNTFPRIPHVLRVKEGTHHRRSLLE